jgi:tRNA(Ile)-lysidine synthase
LRNRLRRELIPLVRRHYQPAVGRVLCRLAELMRAENEVLASQAEAWLRSHRPTFSRLPLALKRRVLLLQARRLGAELDFEAVERLLHHVGDVVNVTANRFLQCTVKGELSLVNPRSACFQPKNRVVVLDAGRGKVSFGGLAAEFQVEAMRCWRRPRPTSWREQFDADAVGRRIVLRHWQAGDRFQPIGMKAAVKLQDLFTNLKVPAGERRRRVVAEAECGELFWVEGLRMSERFKLAPATRRRLIWAWNRI